MSAARVTLVTVHTPLPVTTAGENAMPPDPGHDDEMRADLVAIATQGRGAVGGLLFGGVADEVLRTAAAPVLVRHVGERRTHAPGGARPRAVSGERSRRRHDGPTLGPGAARDSAAAPCPSPSPQQRRT